MHSIIKKTTKLFGGSAVAGMGFSLGRDLYRKAKEAKGLLIAIIALSVAVLGVYTGGVWIGRNYRTRGETFLKRTLGVFMATPTFLALAFVTAMIYPILSADSSEMRVEAEARVPELTAMGPAKDPQMTESTEMILILLSGAYLPLIIGLIGYLAGNHQGKKRTLVWEAEDYNELFMAENHLVEHEDSTIEDTSNAQNYRIDNIGTKRITLFPIGRRGQRAYIQIDDQGKYVDFTGIQKV